jgi:hypothetical protein
MAHIFEGTPGNDSFIKPTGGNNWDVLGFDGDDQFYLAGQGNRLFGGNGNDWLGVNGDSNLLIGDAGSDWIGASGTDNFLFGGAGNDYLTAAGDSNYLSGGAGADNLVFVAGSTNTEVDWTYNDTIGNDALYNFNHEDGLIYLVGWGLVFNTLLNYMHNVGSNVVIDFGGSAVGTIINMQISDLSPDNFVFA